MRLMLVAALSAAVLAGTAGAVEGWRHSPDYPNGTAGYWGMVATRMPTGSPVHVTPECTLTLMNTFKTADPVRTAAASGPIPSGFKPVRAVRCGTYGDGMSETATQSEVRDPDAVKALLDAYRTPYIRTYVSDHQVCPAMAEFDPPIAFVAADGVAILPGAPRDTCDLVISAVINAIQKAPWTVTESVAVHG